MNSDLLRKWLEKESIFPHKGDDLLFQLLHDPRFGLPPQYIAQKSIELYQKNRGKGAGKYSLRQLIAAESDPIPSLFDTAPPHPIFALSRKLEKALLTWESLETSMQSAFLSEFWGLEHTATVPKKEGKPRIQLIPDNLLQPLLDRYSLSVSHLNSFLQCPLKFYYQNLIRVPASGNESMSFGSAVHSALEKLFLQMKADQGRFPSVVTLIELFVQSMLQMENEFSTENFQKKIDYGKKILADYYQQYRSVWNTIVIVEKNIRILTKEGIALNGIMDKLEFNGKDLTIVDYKTGSHSKALFQLHPPSASQIQGGDYWRQAIFYKILIDQDPSNDWKTQQVTFDFIEPVEGAYKRESVMMDPAAVATVQNQIQTVWEQIQSKHFDTGCGKPHCHWCNFVQANHLTLS